MPDHDPEKLEAVIRAAQGEPDWTIHDTDEAVARYEAQQRGSIVKRGQEGLAGHDPSAPAEPGLLTPGTPPGDHRWAPSHPPPKPLGLPKSPEQLEREARTALYRALADLATALTRYVEGNGGD